MNLTNTISKDKECVLYDFIYISSKTWKTNVWRGRSKNSSYIWDGYDWEETQTFLGCWQYSTFCSRW